MKNKHLTFILIFVFFTGILKSQISKGSLILDGNAGLGLVFGQGNDIFNIGVAPDFGVFITDNLVLGGQIGFSLTTSRNTTVTTYQIIPSARYYFGGPTESLKVFLTGELGIMGVSASAFSDTDFQFLLGGGLDLFLNPNVALEGILAYQNVFQDGSDQSQFGVNMGFKFFLAKDSPRAKSLNTSAIFAGSLMVGGSGFIGLNSVSGETGFGIAVQPQLGYFFTDNFMAGANVGLSFSSFSGDSNFSFGLAPKARYYFKSPKGYVAPFAGVGLGVIYDTGSDEAFLQALLEGGVDIFITSTVALEAGLSYQILNLGETNSLSALQFVLGFQKFLGATAASTNN